MMEKQSKHENVITIWDEQINNSPTLKAKLNQIRLYLYFRYKPNLMPTFSFNLSLDKGA